MIDLEAATEAVARVKAGLYGGNGGPTLDLTALVCHAEIALSEVADLRSQLAESQRENAERPPIPEPPEYVPFDQEDHLGESPWRKSAIEVVAWEAAHGHDVRLKCYPEFGCQVAETDAYWRGYRDGATKREYQP